MRLFRDLQPNKVSESKAVHEPSAHEVRPLRKGKLLCLFRSEPEVMCACRTTDGWESVKHTTMNYCS